MQRIMILLIMILTVTGFSGGPDSLVERVEFENADLMDVIKLVKSQCDTPVWCQLGRKDIEEAPKLNISFRRMPAREVLRYACLQSGFSFDITEHGYMSITKTPVLHSLSWPLDIISRDPTPEKLTEYFKRGGVDFPTGSKVYYNRNKSTLTATNTVENLRRIALIAGTADHMLPTPKLSLDRVPYNIVNPMVESKLADLEVGPIDAEEISVRDLLLKLHQESVVCDPKGVGINIFLMPTPEGVDPMINVNLGKMSLKYMLDSICRAAGLEYHFDDFAVVISVPEKKSEVKKDEKSPESASELRPVSADRDILSKPKSR